MEPLASASDPTHRSNDSKFFTHDEEMISCGSILSGPAVLGSDPEDFEQFTYLFITDRALICDRTVAIFWGSDSWTYLNPAKNIVME